MEEPTKEKIFYRVAVQKVRRISKMFRKSSKNDLLQTYVLEKIGIEKTLILDIRTRWNFLFYMVKRFNELKTPIQKVLLDLGELDLLASKCELSLLTDLENALDTMNEAQLCISTRGCNLLTADKALEFVLEDLKLQNSKISCNYCNA